MPVAMSAEALNLPAARRRTPRAAGRPVAVSRSVRGRRPGTRRTLRADFGTTRRAGHSARDDQVATATELLDHGGYAVLRPGECGYASSLNESGNARVRIKRVSGSTNGSGTVAYPQGQPVIEYVFDSPSSRTVRSSIPGTLASEPITPW